MKEISEEYFGSRGFVNTGTLCGIVLKELDLGVHLGCFFLWGGICMFRRAEAKWIS